MCVFYLYFCVFACSCFVLFLCVYVFILHISVYIHCLHTVRVCICECINKKLFQGFLSHPAMLDVSNFVIAFLFGILTSHVHTFRVCV